jgi:predicted ATPase
VSKAKSKPPYLRSVKTKPDWKRKQSYPFSIPAFAKGLNITFTKPVTMFVGENGSRKSTLLEAIAQECGFNLGGGNRNHTFGTGGDTTSALADSIRLSWLPKVTSGFFMRAESFFNFANYVDELDIADAYGGKSLHQQSHGESFLSLFENHFGQQGIYILDEPEAALSPGRQLAFLALLHELEKSGRPQFIIATHSPMLLSYPGASLLSMDGGSIHEIDYRETEHYKITREFLNSPETYFRHLFSE